MSTPPTHPALRSVVFDAVDARGLAEYWRMLLGWSYRPGDEPPPDGAPDPAASWLVVEQPGGPGRLAFQAATAQAAPTWPDPAVPQQLHLDLTVADLGELEEQRRRAVELGGRVLEDRTGDPDEPLWVLADPAGHPFCIFVSPPA